MEVAGIPILTFVSFILIIASFVIHLIGFAAPYWYLVDAGSTSVYAGLWKSCGTTNSITVCYDTSDLALPSWFEAVQAMECLGFILLLVALVVIILKLFVLKDKAILKWVIIGSLAAAAVVILIGVCVYGAEQSDALTEHLHFAFAFVIIAAIVAIVAAVLLCVDMK